MRGKQGNIRMNKQVTSEPCNAGKIKRKRQTQVSPDGTKTYFNIHVCFEG
jgi:hypothetical protein